jgi:hypothetical protein
MNMKKMTVLLFVFAALIAGCASTPMKMPTPPPDYPTACKVLGEGEGSSSGVLIFDLIPVGINQRFENAYHDAVNPLGGTHLVDAVVKEYWYYVYIGIYHRTEVKGKVIKCPDAAAQALTTRTHTLR